MIWNDRLLFVHVPDSGGEVVADFLRRRLIGPVHITSPEPKDDVGRGRVHTGRRHETLVDAESTLAYLGHSLDDFDVVLAVMRDPYQREVARFLRRCSEETTGAGSSQNGGSPSVEGFVEQLRRQPDPSESPIGRYFKMGGQMPPSLRVARFDNLSDDVRRHSRPFLKRDGRDEPLPPPADDEREWWTYYDAEAEELCYQRNRWVFDTGFFPRRFGFGAVADPDVAEITSTTKREIRL